VNKPIFLALTFLSVFLQPAHANPVSRRATITGGRGDGRCTVEVSVDHSAEVEISGDTGLLTTTAGQPALWRRFQCNAPLPRNPHQFRFVRVAGRGTVRLHQDPRSTGGRAVVHVSDPQGGRGNYVFDLQWRGFDGGGWTPGPPQPGPTPGPGGPPVARAIRICQDSVTNRLSQDGYSFIRFERTTRDDKPGRDLWITGAASARRERGERWFSFSCSVDSRSGSVRFVDVQRRR
jgi:hypothetical protein